MRQGRVKWWHRRKFFGFVTDDETGTDYFLHGNAVLNPPAGTIELEDGRINFALAEGQLVAFEVRKSRVDTDSADCATDARLL